MSGVLPISKTVAITTDAVKIAEAVAEGHRPRLSIFFRNLSQDGATVSVRPGAMPISATQEGYPLQADAAAPWLGEYTFDNSLGETVKCFQGEWYAIGTTATGILLVNEVFEG